MLPPQLRHPQAVSIPICRFGLRSLDWRDKRVDHAAVPSLFSSSDTSDTMHRPGVADFLRMQGVLYRMIRLEDACVTLESARRGSDAACRMNAGTRRTKCAMLGARVAGAW